MNIIKLLRSYTATRAPLPAEMQEGQTAVNTNLKGLWMKDDSGNVIQIGVMPSDLAPVATSGDYNSLINKPATSGALQYISPWNANTNTPPIPAAAADNKSNFYVVSVEGTTNIDGNTLWNVGDQLISNGTTWARIPLSQPIDPTSNIGFSLTNGYLDSVDYIFTRQCTFALNFGDSVASIVLATGTSASVNLLKNGVSVGSIVYSSGTTTISSVSGSNTVFNSGDKFTFTPTTTNIQSFSVNMTGQWTL